MIRNYIFDLVGVIGDFGTKQTFQHFIDLGATDVWELNNQMDLGYLSGEDFLVQVQKRCAKAAEKRGETPLSVEQLRAEYEAPMTLPVEHLQWLCELRKKYRVFLLSNVGDMHWHQLVRSAESLGYKLEDCFDAVFPSFQTHVNKPDAKAYLNVLETMDLVPEETIFFDDAPANVAAACALGIHGRLVTTSFPNPEIFRIEN